MEQKFSAGQQVFVVHAGSWSTTYNKVEVVKVTPTGYVDVRFYKDGPLVRFNPKGECLDKWKKSDYFDTMPYNDRIIWLDRQERLKEVASVITSVTPQSGVNFHWGVEALQEEIVRLRALLDAAQEKLSTL